MGIRIIKLLNFVVIFTYTIDSIFASLSGSAKGKSFEELVCIISVITILSLLLVLVVCLNWRDCRIFRRFKFNNLECSHPSRNVIQFPDTFNPDRSVAFDSLPEIQVSIPGSPMDILEKYFFPKIYTEKNLTRIDVEKEVEVLMKTLKSKYHVERLNVEITKEMGKGWFGPVMNGSVREGNRWSKCVVSALNELAAPSQVLNYFKETAAYREVRHANVLRMMYANIDTIPFWTVLECCHLGDLKTYLIAHRVAKESIMQKGLLIRFAADMAMGMNALHDHKYVHRDFAIRNCLVCSDLTIKVGDYGVTIEKFRADYYEWGGFFIPLRWLAPEMYHHGDEIFKLRKMTTLANIWSLGVSIWELISFGILPYPNLSHEDLLQQPKDGNLKQFFDNHHKTTEKLAVVMGTCLVNASKRPTLQTIINQLLTLKSEMTSQHKTLMKDTLSNSGSPCEFLDDEYAFAAESVINENFNSIALSFELASDNDFDVGLHNKSLSAIELKQGFQERHEIGDGIHKTMSFDEGMNVPQNEKFHESVKSYYEDMLKKHHSKMIISDAFPVQLESKDVAKNESNDKPNSKGSSEFQKLHENHQNPEIMLTEFVDMEPNKKIIVIEPGDIHIRNCGDDISLQNYDEPRCDSRISHCSNSDSKIVNIDENSLSNKNGFASLHSIASCFEIDNNLKVDKNSEEVCVENKEENILPTTNENNLENKSSTIPEKLEETEKPIISHEITGDFGSEILDIDLNENVVGEDNWAGITGSSEIESIESPSVLQNISSANDLDTQTVDTSELAPPPGFEDSFTPIHEMKDKTMQHL